MMIPIPKNRTFFFGLSILILMGSIPVSLYALSPGEVLVIANTRVPSGIRIAEYYMEKRHIAKDRLIRVQTTDRETIDRKAYETEIAEVVRTYIKNSGRLQRIRCLVTVFGMPLRITGSGGLDIKRRENPYARDKFVSEDVNASLDSELSLVMASDAPVSGWIPNPFFAGNRKKTLSIKKKDVLMVARLDGPTGDLVLRMIDDTLKAEADGLTGNACFDARWPEPDKAGKLSGYAFYDNSIHLAAKSRFVRKRMKKVIIDNTNRLFQPGECPDTALYCGWYSLSRYIDAFSWKPGAVGYHIASGECVTLKRTSSKAWCKTMIEKGAAATIGPVGEPYVSAFPVPHIFFGFLGDGYLSLVESYYISLPYLSWKMVLIGDPLYRPFRAFLP